MTRTFGIRTAFSVGLVGLVAGTTITAFARAEPRGRMEVASPGSLLGTLFPMLTLRSVDGAAVPLAGRLSHGLNLVILLGAGDCFSCSSFEIELKILKSQLPGITPVLIGSGSDERTFRDYFRLAHLEPVALLDRNRSLLAALGLKTEPLALLVDSAGRILFVDDRSSPAAHQFPLGRLLPILGAVLRPAPSPTSRTGEPK